MTQTSKQFTLDWRDILKGFIVAFIGAAISPIYDSLQAGSFQIDWGHVLAGGLTAGIAYLVKNFFTSSQVVIKTNEEIGGTVGSRPDDRKPGTP